MEGVKSMQTTSVGEYPHNIIIDIDLSGNIELKIDEENIPKIVAYAEHIIGGLQRKLAEIRKDKLLEIQKKNNEFKSMRWDNENQNSYVIRNYIK